MSNKLKGYRVWIGIGAMIIGATGLANYITPDDFEKLVSLIFEIAGMLIAVYGNIKAHQKIKELGGYKNETS